MKKQNKITSFWNMKPIKTQTKPKVNSIKPLFSPRFTQPVNLKQYPTRTKQEWKLIDRKPFGDKDRDRVPNYFDCKPMNKFLQGKDADGKEEYEQEVRTKKPLDPRKSINELKGIKKQSTQARKTGMFLEKKKVYWGEGYTPGGWRVPLKMYTKRYHYLIGQNIPSIVARNAAKARPTRYKEFIKLIQSRDIKNPDDWGNKAGDYDFGMKNELERLENKQQEITALREKGVPLTKEWATFDPRMENYRKLVSMGVPPKIAVIAKSKSITTQFVEGKLTLKDLEKMFKEKGEQRWKNVAEKKRINYEKLRDLGFSSYEVGVLSTRSIENVDDIVANVKSKGLEQAKKDIAGLAEITQKKQSERYQTKLKGNPVYLEQRRKAEKIRRARPGVREKSNEYNRMRNALPGMKEKEQQKYAIKRINELAPGLELSYGMPVEKNTRPTAQELIDEVDRGRFSFFPSDKKARLVLGKKFPPQVHVGGLLGNPPKLVKEIDPAPLKPDVEDKSFLNKPQKAFWTSTFQKIVGNNKKAYASEWDEFDDQGFIKKDKKSPPKFLIKAEDDARIFVIESPKDVEELLKKYPKRDKEFYNKILEDVKKLNPGITNVQAKELIEEQIIPEMKGYRPPGTGNVDFEKLAKDYDAVSLQKSMVWANKYDKFFDTYAWDVESTAWLKPKFKSIEQIKSIDPLKTEPVPIVKSLSPQDLKFEKEKVEKFYKNETIRKEKGETKELKKAERIAARVEKIGLSSFAKQGKEKWIKNYMGKYNYDDNPQNRIVAESVLNSFLVDSAVKKITIKELEDFGKEKEEKGLFEDKRGTFGRHSSEKQNAARRLKRKIYNELINLNFPESLAKQYVKEGLTTRQAVNRIRVQENLKKGINKERKQINQTDAKRRKIKEIPPNTVLSSEEDKPKKQITGITAKKITITSGDKVVEIPSIQGETFKEGDLLPGIPPSPLTKEELKKVQQNKIVEGLTDLFKNLKIKARSGKRKRDSGSLFSDKRGAIGIPDEKMTDEKIKITETPRKIQSIIPDDFKAINIKIDEEMPTPVIPLIPAINFEKPLKVKKEVKAEDTKLLQQSIQQSIDKEIQEKIFRKISEEELKQSLAKFSAEREVEIKSKKDTLTLTPKSPDFKPERPSKEERFEDVGGGVIVEKADLNPATKSNVSEEDVESTEPAPKPDKLP